MVKCAPCLDKEELRLTRPPGICDSCGVVTPFQDKLCVLCSDTLQRCQCCRSRHLPHFKIAGLDEAFPQRHPAQQPQPTVGLTVHDEKATAAPEDDHDHMAQAEQAVASMTKLNIMCKLFDLYVNPPLRKRARIRAYQHSMSSRTFNTLIKDSGLLESKSVTMTKVELVWAKITSSNARPLVSKDQFLEAMGELATLRYGKATNSLRNPSATQQQLSQFLARLIDEYMAPLTTGKLKDHLEERAPKVHFTPQVKAVFMHYHKALYKVYHRYALGESETMRTIHLSQENLPLSSTVIQIPPVPATSSSPTGQRRKKGPTRMLVSPVPHKVDDSSPTWKEIVHSLMFMSLEEFIRFAKDFDIVPTHLTVRAVSQIFWEANFGLRSDDDKATLSYEEFLQCLMQMARAMFCTHFAIQPKPNLTEFDVDMLELLMLKLDQRDKGLHVRSLAQLSPRKRRSKNIKEAVKRRAIEDVIGPQHLSILRQLFDIYSNPADKLYHSDALSRTRFAKFVRDSKLVDGKALTRAQVDITFTRVLTRFTAKVSDRSSLDLEQFYLVLCELVSQRFPKQPLRAALVAMVEDYMAPLLEVKQSEAPAPPLLLQDPQSEIDDALKILRRFSRQLRKIFHAFCGSNLPDVDLRAHDSTTWRQLAHANQTLSEGGFTRLAQRYDIVPTLVSIKKLAQIFHAVHTHIDIDETAHASLTSGRLSHGLEKKAMASLARSGTVSNLAAPGQDIAQALVPMKKEQWMASIKFTHVRDPALTFDEFLMALVFIARQSYSSASYHAKYPLLANKVELLLFSMDSTGDLQFTEFKTEPVEEPPKASVAQLLMGLDAPPAQTV